MTDVIKFLSLSARPTPVSGKHYFGGNFDAGFINVDHVSQCITKLKIGKAPGLEGLMAKYVLLAHPILLVQLFFLLKALLTYSVVPDAFDQRIDYACLLMKAKC